MINIGCNKTDFRTKDFLLNYYRENKENLQRLRAYDISDRPVTLLANNSGWCTVITERGIILQMWAGQLTPCLE